MFINLILVAVLATPTNISKLRPINFYRQNPDDAYLPVANIFDKISRIALRQCSDDDTKKYPVKFPNPASVQRLYAYLKTNPSYFIFRDQDSLLKRGEFFVTIPWGWKRFNNIEIGDPRFTHLWNAVDKITSIITGESGVGFLYPFKDSLDCPMNDTIINFDRHDGIDFRRITIGRPLK